jgi:putative FmdB family regulatory protein
MPNYEFECQDCGKVFEKIQGYDTPNAKCECGGDTIKLICPVRSVWHCPCPTASGGKKLFIESLVKRNTQTGEVVEKKVDYSDPRNIDRSAC